jgi:CheY-like chemotaxis protein
MRCRRNDECAGRPLAKRRRAEGRMMTECLLLSRVRVLVVDDDDTIRNVLQRLLEGEGAEVTTAASAKEALQKFSAVDPHVLLSDIGMPEMDGYEFIRQLRSRGIRVPAVAVTAFARPEDRRRALFSGYHTHLAKPAAAPELIAVVAALAARGIHPN